MKLNPAIDLTVFIKQDGNDLLTDTRAVALAFGKQHAHVMRTIKAKLSSARPVIAENAHSNFGAGFYVDANGQRRPMYRMTAKGLTALALGFSGEDAEEVRIRFVDAFEELARSLESRDSSITQLLHDHAKRASVSEAKATLGSLLMHDRKREKGPLEDELARLKEASQPTLTGMTFDPKLPN